MPSKNPALMIPLLRKIRLKKVQKLRKDPIRGEVIRNFVQKPERSASAWFQKASTKSGLERDSMLREAARDKKISRNFRDGLTRQRLNLWPRKKIKKPK